ncbi:MAG: type III-B CRISPR module RAMP protein Cmr6 [Desulfobacteraceae bacterium]|nr:type III-B CRISPR module RAMP protein Cmr6 [Desulfobacteraceae bacterium]MBC2720253.1 type III-B CRISPR module RAMP protein Cmr6 [Desulfobacteraceae bacterium]
MFYPYSKELQDAAGLFVKGNFYLWFNKLIPLNNERNCKACNKQGNDKEAVQYYETVYNGLKNNSTLTNLLCEKQESQKQFCLIYKKAGYKIINYQAELKSPLITGIGQTHPNEVGMVFDHTLGIPYIPASSVKGIVRFAHILELIKSDNYEEYKGSDKNGEYIVESDLKTLMPAIFGGDADEEKEGEKKIKKLKGKVIFLDAYPAKVPDLHVDIMNPHYGDYYNDEKGEIPPADYLAPNPIKFLAVKKGTVFTFRALVSKDSVFLLQPVKTAFENALKDEGLGAKTAVGYGRFEIKKDQNKLTAVTKQIQKTKTPVEKMLENLFLLKNTETGRISGEIVNKMEKELKKVEDKGAIAIAIKEKLGSRGFRKLDRKKDGYLSNLIKQLNNS